MMRRLLPRLVATILTGVAAAIRARPGAFGLVALGVFVLNLFLPLAVLSLARKPADYFTFNPWLSRLPEYLTSHPHPVTRKLDFLANLALAWFIADSPVEGVEWGFIIDVPSVGRFALTSFLFGAFAVLWFYRRDQARTQGWQSTAVRYGGTAGALTSVLGFSTGACSVMGCGVPVLPVVGLAVTGVSSGTLTFFMQLSRVATATVLIAMTAAVAWFGWLVIARPPATSAPGLVRPIP